MIPGRLDGTIRGAQRFHELHVEIGRQFEQRLRIQQNGAAVVASSLKRRRRGGKRSSHRDSGRSHGGFSDEGSSSHAPHDDGKWPRALKRGWVVKYSALGVNFAKAIER